jgi:hypothetical protein
VTAIHSPINSCYNYFEEKYMGTQCFYSSIWTTRIMVQYISTTRISDLYMTATRISAPFMACKINLCPCLHQKSICGTRLFADVLFGSFDRQRVKMTRQGVWMSNPRNWQMRRERELLRRPATRGYGEPGMPRLRG